VLGVEKIDPLDGHIDDRHRRVVRARLHHREVVGHPRARFHRPGSIAPIADWASGEHRGKAPFDAGARRGRIHRFGSGASVAQAGRRVTLLGGCVDRRQCLTQALAAHDRAAGHHAPLVGIFRTAAQGAAGNVPPGRAGEPPDSGCAPQLDSGDPRPRVRWSRLVQRDQHRGPERVTIVDEPVDHLRHSLRLLVEQRDEEMQRADRGVVTLQRDRERTLEHRLGIRGERDVSGGGTAALAGELAHDASRFGGRDPERHEHARCDAGIAARQGQEEMFAPDGIVVEAPGFFLGGDDHAPGVVSEALEHADQCGSGSEPAPGLPD
jgi:hypothetical protein